MTVGNVCPVCLRPAIMSWVTTEAGERVHHWRHEPGSVLVECTRPEPAPIDKAAAAKRLDPRIGRGS